MSIAAYMRQCLTFPDGGYYTSGGVDHSDIFGRKGDFVTSPEISQVFGELLAVWTVAEWMAQGKRSSGVQLIEVGPGKGTLMADMLRVSNNSFDNLLGRLGLYLPTRKRRQPATLRASHRVLRLYISWRLAITFVMCKNSSFAVMQRRKK